MKYEIKNDKLVDILKERDTIHKEIGKLMEQLMSIDKEKTKLGYKMDKLKEKTKVIMDELNPQVGEFELITRVFLEDDKPYYEVVDLIEEYKQALREKAKKDLENK